MVYSWTQTVPAIVTSVEVMVGVASQRSVAVAVPFVPPGAVLAEHSMVMLGGQVINGGVTSCTTIVRLHVAELPQSSVAVHVRATLYVFGHVPGVVTSPKVTVTVGSHASNAKGGKNTGAAGQLTGVTCSKQIIVGGVLSCTTIVALQVALLPQSSVAVQVLATL
jgi:hypothetical protein